MAITDRMLMGAIAGNPAAFDGAGVYRYCRTCQAIYFTSAKRPDLNHEGHDVLDLPSLNPDGSGKLVIAFQRFVVRWTEERQAELEKFAQRRGWDLAMELKYGGGALEDSEAAEWQEIVNARLDQLAKQARKEIGNE